LPKSEPVAPPLRKNLVQLPLEIRLQIYEHVFRGRNILLIGRTSFDEYPAPRANTILRPPIPDDPFDKYSSALPTFDTIYHSGALPGLLEVCHQIRDEALPIFSQATVVAILPPKNRSRLSAIQHVPRHYINRTTHVLIGDDCRDDRAFSFGNSNNISYTGPDTIDHAWFPALRALHVVIPQIDRFGFTDPKNGQTTAHEALARLRLIWSIDDLYRKLLATGRTLLPRTVLHAVHVDWRLKRKDRKVSCQFWGQQIIADVIGPIRANRLKAQWFN
jgi:hypothetical protein